MSLNTYEVESICLDTVLGKAQAVNEETEDGEILNVERKGCSYSYTSSLSTQTLERVLHFRDE